MEFFASVLILEEDLQNGFKYAKKSLNEAQNTALLLAAENIFFSYCIFSY